MLLFLIGFALFDLLERFPELILYKIFGAAVGHKAQNVIFIARDRRIVQLAHLAYLREDAADLVMLRDGLSYGLVGDIRTVLFVQGLEHLFRDLVLVVLKAVGRDLEGHVDEGHEEFFVLHELQKLKMLESPVHLGAGLAAGEGRQEVVSSLDAALDQRSGIAAQIAGHVIGRDIHAARAGRSESDGEAVVQIQQHLGHMVAGVAHGVPALPDGLKHELVCRLVQQMLEVDQML